ncbi:hypothetical protein I5907_14875 [Panacibacter sp. DH6]|uniref:Lipoprotein n=1 Tax=Panacibacter microcysteis TaxID=2793269 RepID=A0A931E908_9BACT|nr:hypothetical protein [Panacibacter microcysteis]MBG9377525.1 hypothetical protein [Panacibacter microcysteis]
MRNPLLICTLSFLLFACNEQGNNAAGIADSSTAVSAQAAPAASVNETRENVSDKPVASFSRKVPDELNDWKFAVNVYETKQTFRFLMKMQYMELTAADTLKIPNVGMEPIVEIRPGKDAFSCIVGFLDKDKTFKEYKLVTAKDNNLSVKILHRYAAVTYEVK